MIADQACIIEQVPELPTMTLAHAIERPELTLYYRPGCPYVKRVLNALKNMGKTIPMKNIQADPEAYRELVQVGGKAQVPCLFINGRAKYESSAIIRWLQENQDLY